MRLYRQPRPTWAFVIITKRGHWWGLVSSAHEGTCVDLGKWRIGRRRDWTPLFTEVHRLGPVQWWTMRHWSAR